MRCVSLIFVALILLLQHPLWLGKGGWLSVYELERQVAILKQANQENQARNAALDAEVRDLKHGTEVYEERARSELGMVKRGEIFFHIQPPTSSVPSSTTTHR